MTRLPNSPTNTSYTQEQLRRVLALAIQGNLPSFEEVNKAAKEAAEELSQELPSISEPAPRFTTSRQENLPEQL